VVVVALAAWVGWLLARGLMRGKVPWIGIGVIAVPLVVLFWTERQWISSEQQLSAVARSIAPGSAGVHCQRLGEALTFAGAELGHVEFTQDGRPDGPAMLTYDVCTRITDYVRGGDAERSAPTLDEVIAVHVLTHESVHLTGDRNEADTECRAMQDDAAVAQQLGASRAEAGALAVRYATQVYPGMPSEYVSAECRPGGKLDESPTDGVWP